MTNNLYMDGTKLNRHLDEVVKWKNNQWFSPLHMELSMTNICNQHCTFCYIDWSHGKQRLNETSTRKLIKDAKRVGLKSVLIAGEGEPTVNKAYITAIETAHEVGLDIALNTNAVLMSKSEIENIIPKLSWLRISFQAPTKELYSKIHQCHEKMYDQAVNNIRYCNEVKKRTKSKIAIGLQQVLLDDNGAEVYENAKLAKELGCDYYVIKPCHPHEDNKAGFKEEEDLVHKYKDTLSKAETLSDSKFKAIIRWNFLQEAKIPRNYNKCLALPFIVQVTANGEVYTCYPHANKKDYLYGSIHETNFYDLVKSEEFKRRWTWCRDNTDVTKCMPTCRHHNANKYLWWLTEENPDHFNFI